MTDHAEFRRWVRDLRKTFPGAHPVRVLLVPRRQLPVTNGKHDCGGCEATYDETTRLPVRFLIRIDDSLNRSETWSTLCEEWAHYLRMHLLHAGQSDKHDELYGAIFNLIKRHYDDRATES